jgi:hypothetical protein
MGLVAFQLSQGFARHISLGPRIPASVSATIE